MITELQKERATQRQRLETELQAIHRLINFSMQQALHRGLKSAVAAVDALSAAKKSGRKARGTTASLPILNRRLRVLHEVASSADQKVPVAQHSALGHWLLDGRSACHAHPIPSSTDHQTWVTDGYDEKTLNCSFPPAIALSRRCLGHTEIC